MPRPTSARRDEGAYRQYSTPLSETPSAGLGGMPRPGSVQPFVGHTTRWDRHKTAVLEAFVLLNYAFLILDVYLAHLVNRFRHAAEWIPVGFSVAAVLVLAPALVLRVGGRSPAFAHRGGLVVGYASVAVGLAGVLYHLDSQFFSQWTVQSLVYTAPFAAPVAYAGLGFLLLVNRMVPSSDLEWSQWVVFFALGGFVGNFGLALCDHAMNGFFSRNRVAAGLRECPGGRVPGGGTRRTARGFSPSLSGGHGAAGRDRGCRFLPPPCRGHQRPVVQPVRELHPRCPGVRALAVRRPRTPRDDRVLGHARSSRRSGRSIRLVGASLAIRLQRRPVSGCRRGSSPDRDHAARRNPSGSAASAGLVAAGKKRSATLGRACVAECYERLMLRGHGTRTL